MIAAPRPRVGVLALQGDFDCHRAALEDVGAEAVPVTLPQHLADLDALVLPGGESTTMLRLLAVTGLRQPLERFVREKPVLGTCAGVILLGRGGQHLPAPPLGVLDVEVDRNAYGRQVDSFSEPVEAPEIGEQLQGVFIRAPRIRPGARAHVIARHAGEPVGVRQGRIVGLTFHPELTRDTRFHRWFLEHVAGFALPAPAAAAGPDAPAPGAAAGEARP